MSWQLRIEDPSGETRTLSIHGKVTLGRSETSNIVLRDPSVPQDVATLCPMDEEMNSSFWIKICPASPAGFLGDLAIREAQIPMGIPFQLGETRLRLESRASGPTLPTFPTQVRP